MNRMVEDYLEREEQTRSVYPGEAYITTYTHPCVGHAKQQEEDEAITKAEKRKAQPVGTGVLGYFPKALKAVSEASKAGNDQHHPDKPLHWDKTKSTDNLDAGIRHLLDHLGGEEYDDDGVLHLAKFAWRALATLERHLDNEQ